MTIQQIIEFIISFFRKPKGHIQVPQLVSGSPDWIQPTINNVSQNWVKYQSLPLRTQWTGLEDESNCVIRGMIVEPLEAYFNFYIEQNPDDIISVFLKKYYCNPQGYVKISIRHLSKVCGVIPGKGVDVQSALTKASFSGIVPESVYPDPVGNFTNQEYYKELPPGIEQYGYYVARIFKVLFNPIWNNNWQVPDIQTLRNALIASPVGFASAVGRRDNNGIEQWLSDRVYVHARCLCAEDSYQEVLDSYSYPDYWRKLSTSFPLACAIQVGVKIV